MNGVKLRKRTIVLDDKRIFDDLCNFGVFSEKENEITINTKYLLNYLADDDSHTWKSKYEEQVNKVNDLQKKLKAIGEKNKEMSVLSSDIEAMKQQNVDIEKKSKQLSSKIGELQTVIKKKDSEIVSLKKQVDDLQFVRGITDVFGSFRSLQKTLEMFNFIREMILKHGSVRWVEIVNHFKGYRWKETSVEYHLKKLREQEIIVEKRVDIKGEYVINEDKLGEKCKDFDNLAQWILGPRLYDLVKESWMNKP